MRTYILEWVEGGFVSIPNMPLKEESTEHLNYIIPLPARLQFLMLMIIVVLALTKLLKEILKNIDNHPVYIRFEPDEMGQLGHLVCFCKRYGITMI
jgi:hypothetical protein